MLVNGSPGNSIGIRDRGLLYGDGVFRTMRIFDGKVLHWQMHYRKLCGDCAVLGITCPDEETLCSELEGVLAQHGDSVVKLIITRGSGGRGYQPDAFAATRIWDIHPMPEYSPSWAVQGVRARICNLRLSAQPLLAGVKHLNRLENVLAAAETDESGQAAEGLLLDMEGRVIEGMRSNLFMVMKGELVTPDLSRCGVAGVQRERVMSWAQQHGMSLQVRDVWLEEALNADELFIVNSVIGLWPLRELERRQWNRFVLATRIRLDLYSR